MQGEVSNEIIKFHGDIGWLLGGNSLFTGW